MRVGAWLQVPANRIGLRGGVSLAQLKILRKVIALNFVPFALPCMGEGLKWSYERAARCMVAAVYFIFKG